MHVRIVEGEPFLCDMGTHHGWYRVDFRGSAYLTPEELVVYTARGGLTVSLEDSGRDAPGDEKGAGDGDDDGNDRGPAGGAEADAGAA